MTIAAFFSNVRRIYQVISLILYSAILVRTAFICRKRACKDWRRRFLYLIFPGVIACQEIAFLSFVLVHAWLGLPTPAGLVMSWSALRGASVAVFVAVAVFLL